MHEHNPAPTSLDEVLSPAWLTAALAPQFPGVEISAVVPGPVISRIATNARFEIECAGGLPAELPGHLCAKGYFTHAGITARQAGVPEVLFYRDLAASTAVRTLSCIYADIDPATLHSVVITRDVAVEGATFLDATSHYSPDQAAQSLAELAQLHGATWERPDCATAAWLDPHHAAFVNDDMRGRIEGNFHGPIGAGVPDEARDARRLQEAYLSLAGVVRAAEPWSVVHGDAHIGNVFLDGAGRPSFVDWQLVHRGTWALDVGYHLASALPVEDRRTHEADLLRHYLEVLASTGVAAPTFDVAWSQLRVGILHGFYLWSITTKVDPRITTSALTRLGTAVADHGGLSAQV